MSVWPHCSFWLYAYLLLSSAALPPAMQVEGLFGYVFDTSLALPLVRTLLLLRDSPFLKECLFKGRNLLYQIIYLVQESVVIIPQLLDSSFNNSMTSSFSWHKSTKINESAKIIGW